MVDTDNTRRTTDDKRRTMPRVWHKLPTGELKMVQMSFKLGHHRPYGSYAPYLYEIRLYYTLSRAPIF